MMNCFQYKVRPGLFDNETVVNALASNSWLVARGNLGQ